MNYKILDDKNNIYNLNIQEIIHLIKKDSTKKFYKLIDNKKIEINNKIVCETQFICHRINTLNELNQIDKQFGTEIDLRDDYNSINLKLVHDPFSEGERFDEYLKKDKQKTLILNSKSERIELEILLILKKYNIKNYFFLDSSFPMIYLLNKEYKNNNIACRFSEYENIHFFLENKDMFSTVWVDCFSKFPLNKEIYDLIKNENKKICIVSPELQKQPEKIELYRNYIIESNIIPDMICTKDHNIYQWI